MWMPLGVAGLFLVLFFVLLACLLSCNRNAQKSSLSRDHLPPGPTRFPLVGSLPYLVGDIRKVLVKMAAKYGSVFTIYLGSTRVIVLYGQSVIKEALLRPSGVFDARPEILWKDFTHNKGIVCASDRLWRKQRWYTLHVIKNCGGGKHSMELSITDEMFHLVTALKRNTNTPYNVQPLLQKSVTNVMAILVLGKRFHYKDSEFERNVKSISIVSRFTGVTNPTILVPLLRIIPGDPFKYHYALKHSRHLDEVYKKWIQEHILNIEQEKPTDFIGYYRKGMGNLAPENDSTFSEEQLLHIVGDLFVTGTSTIVSTLMWALLYLVIHPDVQSKVHAEINDVIGTCKLPTIKNQKSMPYTQAVISEVQRISDVMPLDVPHSTTQETQLRGFTIPKDTMVVPVLHSIHWDTKLWPQPDKFKPERFISGGKYVSREALMPYSLGRRTCLGQSLAKMELFLFLTNLLQRYTISLPEKHPKPATGGVYGLTYDCKPFDVILRLR